MIRLAVCISLDSSIRIHSTSPLFPPVLQHHHQQSDSFHPYLRRLVYRITSLFLLQDLFFPSLRPIQPAIWPKSARAARAARTAKAKIQGTAKAATPRGSGTAVVVVTVPGTSNAMSLASVRDAKPAIPVAETAPWKKSRKRGRGAPTSTPSISPRTERFYAATLSKNTAIYSIKGTRQPSNQNTRQLCRPRRTFRTP